VTRPAHRASRRRPPRPPPATSTTAGCHLGTAVHSAQPTLPTGHEAWFLLASHLAGSGFGRGTRLSFTDSEAPIDSEASPVGADKGKEAADAGACRRRPRRRRRRRRHRARSGFMAHARRAHTHDGQASPLPARRLSSLVVHPARLSVEPDSEGFREVHSRRRWRRRPSPVPSWPVPADLVGLCFNCLGDDHVKADCRFPSRCRSCRREGHRARNCPEARPLWAGAKRGRSPVGAGGRRGTFRRRSSAERWRAAREETVSARSASTGRSPSVPRCCAPSPDATTQPTPDPVSLAAVVASAGSGRPPVAHGTAPVAPANLTVGEPSSRPRL
jgi:hypothetical protein